MCNVISLFSTNNTKTGFTFWCEGCEGYHGVWVFKPNEITNAKWSWNGNLIHPTFSPSLVINGKYKCHSFIRDGYIQYLTDCTHSLAGQTIQLKSDI